MSDAQPRAVVVRPVAASHIRPLRQEVLRPGEPQDASVYPGDDDAGTVHFGAYLAERLVGIASLYREARLSGSHGRAWRLRGMASAPDVRRQGVGRALLAACVHHVAGHGGGELWCNARTPAVDFYARAGFDVVSDSFEIPGIGPHVVMRRHVPASAGLEADGHGQTGGCG